MERITVVALGPDSADHLTLGAVKALKAADGVLLRTGRHGAAAWLAAENITFETLDALYDEAEDFNRLNTAAAEAVLLKAKGMLAFCYCVADPATDETVAALSARNVSIKIIAGVSQADCARANVLTMGAGMPGALCCVPAAGFTLRHIDPVIPLLVMELNDRLAAGEVKLALLRIFPPNAKIVFSGKEILLQDLDRQKAYDHLSYVYVPATALEERDRYTFGDLLSVMERLRRPVDGCPWDIEQTHESLREFVIEEAYEVVDAVNQGDSARIADELGDLLLQVVFHAQIAKEHGEFDIGDITTAICHKMITRHAHIFGDIHCETAEDVLRSWEAIKKKEKGLETGAELMQDVPRHLPALMRAAKIQKKAKQVGFDWDTPHAALAKVREEADEVQAELAMDRDPQEELGDLLFAVVNTARLAGIQPELALSAATEKFIRRFELMESAVRTDGKRLNDMTLMEMDTYWDAVKREEGS